MSDNKNLLFLWVAVAILMGFALFSVFIPKEKTGYVKLGDVFNEFEFKKLEESKLENIKSMRKSQLDSLELRYKSLVRQFEIEESLELKTQIDRIGESYYLKKKEFEETNAHMIQKSNDQIWKYINQYVKDYGKEYGYELILGAQGSGVLMYGSEGINITQEVSKYVNERYKGN